MQEESATNLIERALRASGQTQGEFAAAAGVHQSTVSRMLRREKTSRQGKASVRLSQHAQNALRGDLATGRDRVLLAFDSIWDGSEEHASAIAGLIQAVADLRPSKD